jgi:hypothetical protein
MAKTKKLKFSRRNPDRIRAQDIHPIAYQSCDAYASLDDEIENDAIRTAGNQPFENPAYYETLWD